MWMPKPFTLASDGRSRVDTQPNTNRERAGQSADKHHHEESTNCVTGFEQDKFREKRRPKGSDGLADNEANEAQPHGLLKNHPCNRPVAGADELQNGYLPYLAQRHGVDDKSDDGGADDGQDDQEHADLFGRSGNQLRDQNLFRSEERRVG